MNAELADSLPGTADASLPQSEARYRALFETLIVGFCTIELIFDSQGKPTDYRFLEINPAFETQTGLRNAQGKRMRELAPNHEAYWFETYGKVALTGESIRFESEAKALGRFYDVYSYRVGGPGTRIVAILFNDITTRKVAEEKAKSQLARLALLHQITRAIGERQDLRSILQVAIRSVEDQLPIDFGCVCLRDESAKDMEVACVGIGGGPLATELALSGKARIPVDENGLARCVGGQLVYEPDIEAARFPFPARLARAGLRSLVLAPLLVESKVFGILVAARTTPNSFSSGECEFLKQLSEHVALAAHQAQLNDSLHRAYEDLRQTQQAVLQQERLKALGQMASGIAHDINNAISPAGLYLESLLEKEPNLSAAVRNQLETVQRAIDDVAATVARMREFYRQRESQLTLVPVSLNRLVEQAMELTQARWSDMPLSRGFVVEMRLELAENLPPVLGIESEIREALTNLIFNAVDAMPGGGTLTLRTKVADGLFDDDPARPQRQVHLEVSDTGVGMDEHTRRRCLEPFFTTKGERGTGLGLAMVYGTAQRHNATIEIDSALGKGTTFRVVFAPPSDPNAGSGESRTAPEKPCPLHILLVDDDPIILKSLRDILESDGHTITAANNGQAGIDAFREAKAGGKPFEVVITDLGMPYLDGRKVASAIKIASIKTPVVLLTGWGQRMIADGEVPAQVDHVMSKPPKLKDLRRVLNLCAAAIK